MNNKIIMGSSDHQPSLCLLMWQFWFSLSGLLFTSTSKSYIKQINNILCRTYKLAMTLPPPLQDFSKYIVCWKFSKPFWIQNSKIGRLFLFKIYIQLKHSNIINKISHLSFLILHNKIAKGNILYILYRWNQFMSRKCDNLSRTFTNLTAFIYLLKRSVYLRTNQFIGQ